MAGHEGPVVWSDQEPRPASIEEMAADYLDQIQRSARRAPYCLLGWPFDGLAAHAMATESQSRGGLDSSAGRA